MAATPDEAIRDLIRHLGSKRVKRVPDVPEDRPAWRVAVGEVWIAVGHDPASGCLIPSAPLREVPAPPPPRLVEAMLRFNRMTPSHGGLRVGLQAETTLELLYPLPLPPVDGAALLAGLKMIAAQCAPVTALISAALAPGAPPAEEETPARPGMDPGMFA